MKKIILILSLIVVPITCLFSQQPKDNWVVYINSDTIPVRLRTDTAYITFKLNPETDYLTLVKRGNNPETGKIQFVAGSETPSLENFPIPLTRYRTGEQTIVKLKKVARNFNSAAINGTIIHLIEITNNKISPIIFIQFVTTKSR